MLSFIGLFIALSFPGLFLAGLLWLVRPGKWSFWANLLIAQSIMVLIFFNMKPAEGKTFMFAVALLQWVGCLGLFMRAETGKR